MVAESVIEAVDTQSASIPPRHLRHDGFAFRHPRETEHRPIGSHSVTLTPS
jgi:hypothetical protein